MLATKALFTGAFPAIAAPEVREVVEVCADGGWAWFNDPRAIVNGGRMFFGWVNGDGHPMAAHYEDGTLSTPVDLYPAGVFEVDDHDDPALLRRSSDGRILAYFATHFGAGNAQYVDVSTDPDDASAFDGPTNIGAAIGAAHTTYMCPVELPDGTIRVFFRDHYDGVNPEWAYADSADGESFSGHTAFVHEPGVLTYVRPFMGADGRIDFVASGHPAYDAGGSIWHFYWEDGSYYKSDGTLITGGLPLDTSDMTEVYDGDTTKGWHWDIARVGGALAIAFATFPGNDGSEHRYQYAHWTGSAWDVHEVADGGGYIPTAVVGVNPIEAFYSGGIAIDRLDPSIVYASVQSGSDWQMHRYITDDDGATWTQTVLAATGKHVRPAAVRDPSAATPRVLWMSGTYASYVDYDVGTMGY